MAQVKYIRCDIYKRGVHVVIGTHEQMMKYAKKEWEESKYKDDYKDFIESLKKDTGGYATTYFGAGECLVLLPSFPNNPKDIAVAAHEMLHATDYILWFCGINRSETGNDFSNEAFSYLLEHLLKNTLEKQGYESIK